MALLATAYERQVGPDVLAKLGRACERWYEGEKALGHIHHAHAGLPPCGEEGASRLYVADELIEAEATPAALMQAQGFDPAPLDLSKANFNPAQPRWPAGDGRDSGRWSGGANIDTAGVTDFLARLVLEAARRAAYPLLSSKTKPANPEVVKPESKPLETPETENLRLPKIDPNSLRHIFDKSDHGLDGLVAEFGSQESAIQQVASAATRDAVKEQGITGQFKIQVNVVGHMVTIKCNVDNGIVNIGTVYIPWTR